MGTASGTSGDRRPVGHHLGELLGYAGAVEPRRDDRVCARQPRVLDHPVDHVLPAVLEQLSVLSHLALAHRLESSAHRLNGTRAAHDQAEGDVKVPLDCDAWRPVWRQLAGPAAGADCVMPVTVGTPAAAPPYPGARREHDIAAIIRPPDARSHGHIAPERDGRSMVLALLIRYGRVAMVAATQVAGVNGI